MKRGTLKRAAAVFFAIAAAAPARGLERNEQRNVYASAGRETRIASYGAPDETCRAGAPPVIEVVERPSYGTLVDKPVRILAERRGLARPDHPCVGKFIEAVAVYYRPVTGFHGSDRLRLRVTFDAPTPRGTTTLEEEIFIAVR